MTHGYGLGCPVGVDFVTALCHDDGDRSVRSRLLLLAKHRRQAPPLTTQLACCRYLKNKYGPRKEGKDGGGAGSAAASSAAGSSSSVAARRLSLGLPLSRHNSASIDSSDDDQKNPVGSPTSPTAATAAAAGMCDPLNVVDNAQLSQNMLRGPRGINMKLNRIMCILEPNEEQAYITSGLIVFLY